MRTTLVAFTLFFANYAQAEVIRYVNAVVFDSDAHAFTVSAGRFVANSVPADRQIDLKGAFVVPGLVDGHAHLAGLGKSMTMIDLRGTESWDSVVQRVIASAPPSGWIAGRGWDQNDWKIKEFPTHQLLSKAFPKRPVLLTRVDGHAVVANRAAMDAVGIRPNEPDPGGGRILRDGHGKPSGVFIDSALERFNRARPAPTVAELKRAITRAASKCVSLGLTGIHEMGIDAKTVRAYKELDDAGKLPIRVWAYLSGLIPGQKVYTGRNFNVVGVKFFADGALGSRGAALLKAYSDETDSRGLLRYSPERLKSMVAQAAGNGFQVAIHAIGDRGIRIALDALRRAPATGRPHRIEHAQVVAASDFERFKSQGIIASMQPTHCTSDMPWAEDRVGAERIKGAYAWRTMANYGVPIVFGSDFPVEAVNPLYGVYSAVSRQDHQGKPANGWYSKQRLTTVEALRAFSVTAAKAVGASVQRADFVVFDKDLTQVKNREILRVQVKRVIVDGKQVYLAR
jgi:predicted amidohydrolase YtcJ